jgi:hypothetical protein
MAAFGNDPDPITRDPKVRTAAEPFGPARSLSSGLAVHTLPFLGLELPALRLSLGPEGPAGTLEDHLRIIDAGAGLLDVVWAGDTGVRDGRHADALTLAAGLAESTGVPAVGVIADVGLGRHPAVLARDLITLDLLTRGRAVLALRDDPWGQGADGGTGPPGTGSGSGHLDLRRLGEAVAICRSMFTGSPPPAPGRYFSIGAVNEQLRPEQPEGPLIVVEVVGVGRRGPDQPGAGDEEGFALLLGAVDGVIVGGGPQELAAGRRRIDDAVRRLGLGRPVPLIRRVPLDASAGSARGEVDGVILSVPGPRMASPEAVAEAVADAARRWSR